MLVIIMLVLLVLRHLIYLSRLGYNVINIDSTAGAGYGTTSYSGGICRMFYSILDSVKF